MSLQILNSTIDGNGNPIPLNIVLNNTVYNITDGNPINLNIDKGDKLTFTTDSLTSYLVLDSLPSFPLLVSFSGGYFGPSSINYVFQNLNNNAISLREYSFNGQEYNFTSVSFEGAAFTPYHSSSIVILLAFLIILFYLFTKERIIRD